MSLPAQRDLVAASEHCRAGHDIGGPLRRHKTDVERLTEQREDRDQALIGIADLIDRRRPDLHTISAHDSFLTDIQDICRKAAKGDLIPPQEPTHQPMEGETHGDPRTCRT